MVVGIGMRIRSAPLIDYGLALLWLVMGLYCKVLGYVPRHQEIVGAILGEQVAPVATVVIGVGEVLLAVWIVWGVHRRLAAVVQIVLIVGMNSFELWFAAEYLLWGPLNFLFALMLCIVIYWNGYNNPRANHATGPAQTSISGHRPL